ncbi:hypothetical protein [Mesorhizobium sp. B2-6-7]|uniref:hypothetical protein n=1 Tax=Mesorhizobium sp. B2-6-7 TaxID=2589910 RepID=UPI001127AE46|nr:hypothetical protein [Mesorhizobium sp. B2-6-7]TPJ55011.1 hypothetical protein FJ462_32970 [Mesorhizobium sp. B2-6-7]
MKSAYLAKFAQPGRARNAQMQPLPVPRGGWYTSGNLAQMPPATAQRLENWRPTTTGIQQRGGSLTHASITDGSEATISLITYNAASNKRLFAASETKIFDVTTVVDPLVPPSPDVTGQTNGYYSFLNFTTGGDEYLTVVNGSDPLLLYNAIDGWIPITGISSPAITGADTSTLSFVWAYRNREFFIGPGLIAYCLPVSSIVGPLTTIDLNGVFMNGGALVFGATWSTDTGDGLDDKCVFVTNQGEVAVFEGADPSTAADWNLVGRYDLAKTMGPRCTMRSGGDLLIGVDNGIVPLSAVVTKDIASLESALVTAAISPDWRREAAARDSLPWEIVKWPRKSYAIVSLPATADEQALCYVVNTDTGAWCSYTGWDTRCMVLHNNELYFGTNDGRVKRAEVTGSDDGAPIYYTCIANPDAVGLPSVLKTVLQARVIFKGTTPYNVRLSVSMDYAVDLPAPPDAAPDTGGGSLWGIGRWGIARWGATVASPMIGSQIKSLGRTGYTMQWQLQITGAQSITPNLEMISIDVAYETGKPVI